MSATVAHTLPGAATDPGCANLGDAADFVVFSDGDFSSATPGGTSINGRIAAARDVTLDGVFVGPASGDSAPTVIAGDDFTAGQTTHAGGTVNGGVQYGGSYDVAGNFTVNGGTQHASPPFSFASNFDALRDLSRAWGRLPQSPGATVALNPYSQALELTGRDRGLNVFDVSAADLRAAAGIVIDLTEAGASALINVTTAGTLNLDPMYMNLSGSAASTNVAWNVPFAPGLNVTRGVGWKGLILAPNAALTGSNHPQLEGQLIADTIPDSDWVLQRVAFTGCLPPVHASPDISSKASRTVRLGTRGAAISDAAFLTAGEAPTGTITFSLYGPNDPDCSGAPVYSATSTVDGNGRYVSHQFDPEAAGSYRWRVEYSGDHNNDGAGPTGCDDRQEDVKVRKARPRLSSSVPDLILPAGRAIYDTAELTGAVSPTGTLTFRLYGPGDGRCSLPPVFTSGVPVSGEGPHNSDAFTPQRVGEYRWRVDYSGDRNNLPVRATDCGAPREEVFVTRARPSLSTLASGTIALGGQMFDRATVSGGARPRGTLVFRVYGPSDRFCTGRPAASSNVRVSSGNDTYRSADYTPTTTGIYRWRVIYTGDLNNRRVATSCGGPGETVAVARIPLARPDVTSSASAGGLAGSPVHDTATLAGGASPTGTITFELYGPANGACHAPPVASSTVPVSGDGDYDSGPVAPGKAGTYLWVVTYSGDEHNASAGPTACGAASETVTMTKAKPAIDTQSSPGVAIGGEVYDTAHLAGGSSPRGAITFRLFRPDDAGCSGPPAFTARQGVTGNGAHPSPSFTPDAAGTYRWTASYSGDRNNLRTETKCGDAGETVVVGRAAPALSTSASPVAGPKRRVRAAGLEIYDTATVRYGSQPTGEITFALYGPSDPTCSGPPLFATATAVTGNGTYNSETFTPTASGAYRWIATYSGDAANQPAGATACGEATERVDVTVPAQPQLASSASLAVTVGGAIHDTAHLTGGARPGGTIRFRLYGARDAGCTGPALFTSTVPVSGNRDYDSGSYVPSRPGEYRWVADYSGDAHNLSAGPTACDEAAEVASVSSTIIAAVPSLSTTAASAGLGAPTTDTAHLTGGRKPGGAITFELFGPDDPSCSAAPIFVATSAVNGNGDYTTPEFVLPRPGSYHWVASYSGDLVNRGAGPTTCGAPGETAVAGTIPRPSPDPGPHGPAPEPTRKPRPTSPPPSPPSPPPPAVTG